MRTVSAAGIILFIAASIQTYAQITTIDLSALAKKARPAVYFLETYDANQKELATASGFIVSGDGKLITNYHVIEDAHGAVAKSEGGAFLPVEGVLAVDPVNDLAVLKIDGRDLPFLNLGSSDNLEAGVRISVIGSPLGLEGTLSEGIISAVREVAGLRRWLQITAPISHGSSGSPVFDTKGEVVGVATMMYQNGQSLNFAVVVEAARKLLTSIPNTAKPQPFTRSLVKRDKDIRSDPDFLATLAALTSGDYARSLSHSQVLVKKYPEDSLAHFVMGIAYHYIGFASDAITAFQQAIKLNPEFADAWNNLGSVYRNSGRTIDAINAIQQAVKLKPDDADAWYNLGIVYSDSRRIADAIAAYKQAIKLKPDYSSAWFNLGNACDKAGRITDAIAAYQQAIKLKPDHATWGNLGNVYGKAGRTAEEIAAHKQAILLEPDDADEWYNLGVAYGNSGRIDYAIEAYQQAITRKPDFAQAWGNLGHAYNKAGRNAEAVSAYRKARELDRSIRQ